MLNGVGAFAAAMHQRQGATRLFMTVRSREGEPRSDKVSAEEMSAHTLARVVSEALMQDKVLDLAARLRSELPGADFDVQPWWHRARRP